MEEVVHRYCRDSLSNFTCQSLKIRSFFVDFGELI